MPAPAFGVRPAAGTFLTIQSGLRAAANASGAWIPDSIWRINSDWHNESAYTDAWNGAVYAPERRKLYLIAPGGHGDSGYNGILCLDLTQATLPWTQPNPPSDVVDVNGVIQVPKHGVRLVGVDQEFDGRIASRHSYGPQCWSPTSNRALIWGGSLYSAAGTFTLRGWRVDVDNATAAAYTDLGTGIAAAGNSPAGAWYAATNELAIWGPHSIFGLHPTTGYRTIVASANSMNPSSQGAMAILGDEAWLIGGGSVAVANLAAGTAVSVSGNFPDWVRNAYYPSLSWHPPSNRLVLYQRSFDGNAFVLINPVTRAIDRVVTLSGTPPPPPLAGFAGTFAAFQRIGVDPEDESGIGWAVTNIDQVTMFNLGLAGATTTRRRITSVTTVLS